MRRLAVLPLLAVTLVWHTTPAKAKDVPDTASPTSADTSVRQIPVELYGTLEHEFAGFLREGRVRPFYLTSLPGEDPQQAFTRLFELKSPSVEARAPNVGLFDPSAGEIVRVESLYRARPVLLVFGSYSCPIFRSRLGQIEWLAAKFRDQLSVVIVYTLEAHPVDENPYVRGSWLTRVNEELNIRIPQHRSMEERVRVARQPPEGLTTPVRVLVDPLGSMEIVDKLEDIESFNPMNNPAWKAYGALPNSAYLIDTTGVIAFRMAWFNPDARLLMVIDQLVDPLIGGPLACSADAPQEDTGLVPYNCGGGSY